MELKKKFQNNIVSPVDRMSEGYESEAYVVEVAPEADTCTIRFINQVGRRVKKSGVHILTEEIPSPGDIVGIKMQYSDVFVSEVFQINKETRKMIKDEIHSSSHDQDVGGYIF